MSKWRPEDGEDFYYIDHFDFSVFHQVHDESPLKTYYTTYTDNCFRTFEQATEAAKAIKELLKGLKQIEGE